MEEGETQPVQRGVFGLYVGRRWYRLVPRRDDAAVGVESLDVSRLHREVLEPIFGFGEAGDPNLEFVSDAVPIEELTRRVDEDGGAAFTLMPPTFDQFVEVADRHEQMPAKATYFDPKPQSGLFLRLEDEAGSPRTCPSTRDCGPRLDLSDEVGLRIRVAVGVARMPIRELSLQALVRRGIIGVAPEPVAEREVSLFPLAARAGTHGCGTLARRPRPG